MYQRGDILKLSEEGLNWLYKSNPKGKEGARQWRFEYRCETKKVPECLTVKKLPQGYHRIYHQDFLGKA